MRSARGAAKADQQVEKAVAQAKKEHREGNYRRAVELLQPFVEHGARKLTPQQELGVVRWLAVCSRMLHDCKAELPHAVDAGVDPATAPPTTDWQIHFHFTPFLVASQVLGAPLFAAFVACLNC
jgi:hypothetical protein